MAIRSISIDGKTYQLDLPSLIKALEEWSNLLTDGHWTLMKFTSGYKCVIGTPDWSNDLWTIEQMKPFDTPVEAMLDLIKKLHIEHFAVIGKL
jgi:hypothetical protein